MIKGKNLGIVSILTILILITFVLIWIIKPQEILLSGESNSVKGISFIIITLLISILFSKIINIYTDKYVQIMHGKGKTTELASRIITIGIFILAIIIILKYFSIAITPIIAALGIGGIIIGLALQSTLSNLFAGIQILTNKPIKVGDYIEVGTHKGSVEDIGWRSIRVKTLLNSMVIIPNSKLIEGTIINNSLPKDQISIKINVGVDYGSNLEKVEKITIEVAKEIQRKLKNAITDFKPLVGFNEFGDSNIKFKVILRVKNFAAKYEVAHEFIKELKARFNKENIEISWPIRKISEMK